MSAVTKFQPRYRADNVESLLEAQRKLAQSSMEWVNALRQRGAVSLTETGLPTQKLERWKYSNLPAKLKKIDLSYSECDVSFNGSTQYVSSFKDTLDSFPEFAQKMIEQMPPGHEQYGDMMLWQANNAFLKDGFILDVPKGATEQTPLEVEHIGHGKQQTSMRQIIRIAEGGEFTLIERQSGEGAYWNNIVTQIEIAKGATFKHYRFQENSDISLVTHSTHVVMEEESNYEAFTFTTGANLSRNQVHVDIKGEQTVCRLNGVNMLDGSIAADTTITVEHQAPNCNSYQDYRTVTTDKATGTFQGKIHVRQIAQKTDGYQMAKSLLLSGQATINTKPELEIYADDVKCSHGATTGRLDEEALFYLQSRGIPENQARNLLIQAFVNEVIEVISNNDVQERATQILERWLNNEQAAANKDKH